MSHLAELGSEISHIVVFPYNQNLELDTAGQPRPKLSVLSRMAIDAAAGLRSDNSETRLVLPGATCYPADLPDTTDQMIERAQQVAGLPDDAFAGLHQLNDGRLLNNTHLQAEAVSEYFRREPFEESERVLTLALDYHMERARQACEVRDIPTEYATVEAVLGATGQMDEYERYLACFRALRRSEWLLNALNRIDPTGERIANPLAGAFGARMVDFVDRTAGDDLYGQPATKLVVDNMFAAKKFKEVTGHKPAKYTPAAAPHKLST